MTDTPDQPARSSDPAAPHPEGAPADQPAASPATPAQAASPAAQHAAAQPAPPPVSAAPVAEPPRRFNGLGLTALIFAILAWLVTVGGILLFSSAFSGSSEGSHLVVPFLAFLASAGIALLVSVPIGVIGAILAFISFFLRNRGKVLGIIGFILALPFVAIAVFAALALAGVFAG